LGNIVQDPAGNIVATDRSAHLVYRIDMQGNKEIIAGNGTASGGGEGSPALETGFNEVRGVWFLQDNSYFLATHQGSQVWYIDNSGVTHLFLDGQNGDGNHSGDGENYRTPGYKISEPRAVTVDFQGNVLITENDLGFIRRVAKSDAAVRRGLTVVQRIPVRVLADPLSGLVRVIFSHPGTGEVKMNLYDITGRIKTVDSDYRITGGRHEISLNSRDLSTGQYNIILKSDHMLSVTEFVHVY
jgi:hypothetical protein